MTCWPFLRLPVHPSKMNAGAKACMTPDVFPLWVEALGLGEMRRIVVRRAEQDKDPLARLQDRSTNLDLIGDNTEEAKRWTIVAHGFFNHRADQVRLAPHRLPE
jgi:hypothetical protein